MHGMHNLKNFARFLFDLIWGSKILPREWEWGYKEVDIQIVLATIVLSMCYLSALNCEYHSEGEYTFNQKPKNPNATDNWKSYFEFIMKNILTFTIETSSTSHSLSSVFIQ